MKSKTNKTYQLKKTHPAPKTYTAGIDLHSNNLMLAIVDETGARIKHRKLNCDLQNVLQTLEPFRHALTAVAVESTFNWYWLVDGLQEQGYPVLLANPAAIVQYNGIKHADDKNDAYFLAELLRLGILPTGHIYDAQMRPVRDLLRRRTSLVEQRTSLILSLKSLHHRTTGQTLSLSKIKAVDLAPEELFEHPAERLIATMQKEHIDALSKSITTIEKEAVATAKSTGYYERLKTLPGIGVVLGLTITLEVGDISRFKSPGDFASYARTVDSRRLSNGKQKGANNQKCGNKYLAWAFVEGANFAKRNHESCRRWFERKSARSGNIIATKALACKLAKAAWHIMKTGEDYDEMRMFPHLSGSQILGEQSSACIGVGS